MLVIPALLAFIAPSAADFDDLVSDATLRPPDVTVRELERFIRDFAAQREAENPELPGEERPVWWHWLQMQQEATTKSQKRPARLDATYLVYDVLQFLHAQHLLIKVGDAPARGSVYRPRRRILAHYRDFLVDDLFTSLRHFAQARGGQSAVSAKTDGSPA